MITISSYCLLFLAGQIILSPGYLLLISEKGIVPITTARDVLFWGFFSPCILLIPLKPISMQPTEKRYSSLLRLEPRSPQE